MVDSERPIVPLEEDARARLAKAPRYTGNTIAPAKVRSFAKALAEGMSVRAASKQVGISRNVGSALKRRFEAEQTTRLERRNRTIASAEGAGLSGMTTSKQTMAAGRAGHGNPWANGYATLLGDDELPGPIPLGDLSEEAARALEDFGYFRRRYLGRGPSPWQEDAGNRCLVLLQGAQQSRDKEFTVINAPPGTGKSTLFTHDLSVWLICRDRRIRILIGSRTTGQAMKYTRRIRQTLQQRDLMVPKEEDLRAGLAVMPTGVLVEDFGRFKPVGRGDVWQAGGFTVAQQGDIMTGEKEPTVTAFGFDADYMGMRVGLSVWDDLVDPANVRSLDVIEKLQEDWDNVAEARGDPGSLTALQGQRIKHNDLYRYNLDKRRARDEEDEETERSADDEYGPKYQHIIYRAHDESRCRGLHKRSDPPQDPRLPADDPNAGCLLDPRRLPWRDLKTLAEESPETYRVVYQQEDLDPGSALIQKIWVDGGKDEATGALHLGCWDHDRGLWEMPDPKAIPAPNHLAMVIDPSPSNWWACQLWLFNASSERRYLLAIDRRRMEAPGLLDYDHDRGCFSGLLEDWWQRGQDTGCAFRYVVAEVNAAQKWLLQYDHAKRWAQVRGVNFVPHTTGIMKTDEKRGIPGVQGHWRSGRIRLPGKPDGSKQAAVLLVNEMLRWPNGATDDQVLAHWFFEFTLPKLSPGKPRAASGAQRPSWLGGGGRALPQGWVDRFANTGAR